MVGQADGLRKVAIEHHPEASRAAQQVDLTSKPITQGIVIDPADELIQDVCVVGRHCHTSAARIEIVTSVTLSASLEQVAYSIESAGRITIVADNKQTKTIGEHHVASELARRGWAPALTRDGLERTDILAIHADGADRRQIEVQVKTTRFTDARRINWMLGVKSQNPSAHPREYFALVAVPDEETLPPRSFIAPRDHVAAAAWISHMNWLTEPGVPAGKRNATLEQARVAAWALGEYENRWDLLHVDGDDAPVMLPTEYRDYALEERVGLPPEHRWNVALPDW